MNQQICLKRVQKRNEKYEQKLLLKHKKCVSEHTQEKIKIKMPFVFVRASKHNNYNPSKFEGTSFEWKIQAPLNLYGDTDVLEMM